MLRPIQHWHSSNVASAKAKEYRMINIVIRIFAQFYEGYFHISQYLLSWRMNQETFA